MLLSLQQFVTSCVFVVVGTTIVSAAAATEDVASVTLSLRLVISGKDGSCGAVRVCPASVRV